MQLVAAALVAAALDPTTDALVVLVEAALEQTVQVDQLHLVEQLPHLVKVMLAVAMDHLQQHLIQQAAAAVQEQQVLTPHQVQLVAMVVQV
jgi:hypothetical protein